MNHSEEEPAANATNRVMELVRGRPLVNARSGCAWQWEIARGYEIFLWIYYYDVRTMYVRQQNRAEQ